VLANRRANIRLRYVPAIMRDYARVHCEAPKRRHVRELDIASVML
jgi:hypothetical protein